MARLHQVLDSSRMGREAQQLIASLRSRVVGQEEAIAQIAGMYQAYLAGLASPGRPIANLLFLGPTGSGKTLLAEATAESLAGAAQALIKIDCAEFQHGHEIAKLIGSPPGYLGHRETHPLLSQQILDQHHTEQVKISFVLFDEIEKASDALWNLLLGILDKATLTLGDNRKVDFSRAMIFMTSNLGAGEMEAILRPKLGFAVPAAARERNADGLEDKLARTGVAAARRKFTPEFINRIDKVLVFHPLGESELHRILDLELNLLQRRILTSGHRGPFAFRLTGRAKQLLFHEGTDARYGARHLKRAIERELVQPLSNLIATGQIRTGDLIHVDLSAQENRLTFCRESEGLTAHAMAELAQRSTTAPVVIQAAEAAA